MLKLLHVIVLIAISKVTFSQDDPCKFIDTLYQSHCSINNSLISNSIKSNRWKHQYSNEWQFLCFSPNLESQNKSKLFQIYQLNSQISQSIAYTRSQTKIFFKLQDELLLEFIPDSALSNNRDLALLNVSVSRYNSEQTFYPYSTINLESQKFNKYQFSKDSSGNQVRTRESTFLSPATAIIHAGIKFSLNPRNEFNIGLASTRIKWINDKKLYQSLKMDQIQGVLRNVKPKPDGGFALNGQFENRLFKDLKIEQTCRVFYPLHNRKSMDIELRNKLSYAISKHLKSSIQTIYTYSETRWPPSLWRTELRIGYALDN